MVCSEVATMQAGGKGVRRELMELCENLPNQAPIHGRCLEQNWDFCFSEEHTVSHSLGTRASLDSTMIQCNMAHVSLDHYMEAEDNIQQIQKERAVQEDGNSESHKRTFQRGWRSACTAGSKTDKEVGNFWAWFWLLGWWGARKVLGLQENRAPSRSAPSTSKVEIL